MDAHRGHQAVGDVCVRGCRGTDSATQAAVMGAWLHGQVLCRDHTLLVPGDLSEPLVAEALRRNGYGAVVGDLPRSA